MKGMSSDNSQRRYNTRNGVYSTEIDGEIVLLDSKQGVYFSLNQSGAFIWRSIEKSKSVGEISEELMSTFQVSVENSIDDVNSMIQTLLAQDLITQISDRAA